MPKPDDLFRAYAAKRAAMGQPLRPNRQLDYENAIIVQENAKAGIKLAPKRERIKLKD